ncbi:flagellar hook-associated protein FlgK [Oceanobacillus sp. CAU 1775]
MSSFHGLELAKRALFTQQSALYTTGHNIANANTEGYSRQRVNFEADIAYPAAARNRPGIPGQIGTGVEAGSIQRIRDEFLDLQFRGENSLAGYWEKRADALGRMENLMNELNDTGLSATMDQFWNSLQDLAVNPTNAGARSVVVQRGIALADTFNYYNESLTQIRTDLKKELDTTVDRANTILENVHELNDQIKKLEINGYLPNDLYDRRDSLINQLSQMIDIEVEVSASSPTTQAMAEGLVTIRTGGEVLVEGRMDQTHGYNQLSLEYGTGINPPPLSTLQIYAELTENGDPVGTPLGGVNITEGLQRGTIHSLIQTYGYEVDQGGTTVVNGDYIEMLGTLKNIADVLTVRFNEVQTNYGNPINSVTYPPFFEIDEDTGEISVNTVIQGNPSLIRATEDGTGGDGSSALELAKVFEEILDFANGSTSVKDYYGSVIGNLAVKMEDSLRMSENTGVLLSQISRQRDSISSVSLDEEMTNMIKFQHAYNAAARSMTATDELLDRIINNMGLVGR